MSERKARVESLLKELSAEFISVESNRTSLITVTGVAVAKDLAQATVLVTVFPESQEHAAIDFLNRKRKDFRALVKKRLNLKRIPKVSFALDIGEKNRQRIDEIARNT